MQRSSLDKDVEISERLHSLADGLPQGTLTVLARNRYELHKGNKGMIESVIETDRQAERQTDRQTDIQALTDR